jgi:uncharacterized membrane protein
MLGIVFAVLAATCFGLSTTMQKYCLRRMKKLSFERIVKNRVWMISILVGVIGITFYLTALKYEQISIVQPMLAISIAIPVLVGWLGFNEKIRSRWIHILLIILGVLLISL